MEIGLLSLFSGVYERCVHFLAMLILRSCVAGRAPKGLSVGPEGNRQ